jgi:DNA-binding transcriptional ArsR family regulator
MNVRSYKCCLPNTREFNKVASLSELLKLVGEESRLQLLCLLRQERHCVCEMIDHLDMSQSLISHHLADLKAAGLVEDQKQGRKVYYSLTRKAQKITEGIFALPVRSEGVKR